MAWQTARRDPLLRWRLAIEWSGAQMKILITGISGKLAQQVAVELSARGHALIGIDRRPWPDAPEGVQLLQTDIRKPEAEELFRSVRPDAVIHMATVSHLTTRRD